MLIFNIVFSKIVIPSEPKRLEYLAPMGVNYRELEGDFF
jgi:hypothetical protein